MRNMSRNHFSKERGFTLLELVVVVAVSLVVGAMAIPNFITATRSAHLKGAVSDFSGLLQTERIRAVDGDNFYPAYVLATGNSEQAFVDIAGLGATTIDPKDPVIQINSEVVQKPVGSAPQTANLQALFLPANATVALYDGSVTANPITFGPRGLPCYVGGGQVCKTHVAAGDVCYWIFFQNTNSLGWGAITVTPAGRIQRWLFTGGAAGHWAKY
jgi:prepilin-type N-terminal cleavage/methylation domain-containing protein